MNKLYRDTVTLYHADAAAQTVVRTVLRGVCWQQGRRELPDAGGTRRGAALLVVIVHLRAQFPAVGASGLPGVVEIFGAVLLVTFASTGLGLLLSAAVGREDRVMSLMPLFLIPQIVFAGVVFKLEGSARLVSWLTFSRWGIEAMGATVNLPELHRLASYVMPVEALVFPFDHSTAYLRQNLGILLALTVVCIGLTVVALKRQDARA